MWRGKASTEINEEKIGLFQNSKDTFFKFVFQTSVDTLNPDLTHFQGVWDVRWT